MTPRLPSGLRVGTRTYSWCLVLCFFPSLRETFQTFHSLLSLSCPFLLWSSKCKTSWTTCCSQTGPNLSNFHVLVQVVPSMESVPSISLGPNLINPSRPPLPEAFPALHNEKHSVSPLDASIFLALFGSEQLPSYDIVIWVGSWLLLSLVTSVHSIVDAQKDICSVNHLSE